jgi:hypothetical protein
MQATVFDKDSKIRTEQGAQSAVNTITFALNDWGMISFRIRVFRHHQHLLGAEFHTKSAAFASFFDDVNDSIRDLKAFTIQRLPPVT